MMKGKRTNKQQTNNKDKKQTINNKQKTKNKQTNKQQTRNDSTVYKGFNPGMKVTCPLDGSFNPGMMMS